MYKRKIVLVSNKNLGDFKLRERGVKWKQLPVSQFDEQINLTYTKPFPEDPRL